MAAQVHPLWRTPAAGNFEIPCHPLDAVDSGEMIVTIAGVDEHTALVAFVISPSTGYAPVDRESM